MVLKMRKTIVRKHRRKGKIVRRHMRRLQPSPEYLEYLPQALKKDGRVAIKNIGVIKLKKVSARKARPGRNPFTGESIMIKAKPASKRIKFYPSSKLKERVI